MGARSPFTLTASRPRVDLVTRLGRRFQPVGLAGVLGDLDRTAEACPVPGEAAGPGFTWDADDRNDPSWWPQGVASLRSGEVLLVGWYAKRRSRLRRTPGARISVVDRTASEAPRYRHVLLVAPHRRFGVLTVGTVPVHAGGIAVLGDFLYVADTFFGVRLFRLRDVLRTRSGTPGPHGYDYVLPQLMALRVPLLAGRRRLSWSFLSIGEAAGRPSLVVGEYRRARAAPPRLVRYALDPDTGLPIPDARGRVAPVEVHEHQPSRMQGAAVHGDIWWLTASAGEGVPGDLYVGAPGAWTRHRGVLPTGPEDLDWARPGEELWSVSEWPRRRWVFPVATTVGQGSSGG